jgi:phosphatidylinositol kinase/protein kinase (PI-3  family)
MSSPHASLPGWSVRGLIVKSNDELLQEQFAVGLIGEFDRIFRFARLPLRLTPYRILATSPTSGFIEVVPDAKSLDSVKKTTGPNYISLAGFFRQRYGGPASVSFHRARRNFVQSLAAYSVVSYLLQLKDRHNGNILLHANGALIHIDFGFLLSNSPGKNLGFETAPFKLTGEWVDLMGGVGSPWFRYYSTLVIRGFQEARRHRDKLLLVALATYRGVGGQLPCFRAGEQTLTALRQRFQPDMSHQQAARFAASLIDASIDNWRTGAYDCYQRCCLGIL